MKHYLIITMCLLVILVLIGSLFSSNTKLTQAISNISASNDVLREIELKNGNLVFEKQMLSSSVKDLKEINKDLYDSVSFYNKKLKMKTGSIQVVTLKGTSEIKYEKISVINKKVVDSVVAYEFHSEHSDSIVSSITNVSFNTIQNDSSVSVTEPKITTSFSLDNLKLNVMTGFRRKTIFKPSEEFVSVITTNDERFKIDKIESWKNSEEFKKKPFISLRPGIYSGIGYDPFKKEPTFSAGIGATLQIRK